MVVIDLFGVFFVLRRHTASSLFSKLHPKNKHELKENLLDYIRAQRFERLQHDKIKPHC